jgi:hypothetical protein
MKVLSVIAIALVTTSAFAQVRVEFGRGRPGGDSRVVVREDPLVTCQNNLANQIAVANQCNNDLLQISNQNNYNRNELEKLARINAENRNTMNDLETSVRQLQQVNEQLTRDNQDLRNQLRPRASFIATAACTDALNNVDMRQVAIGESHDQRRAEGEAMRNLKQQQRCASGSIIVGVEVADDRSQAMSCQAACTDPTGKIDRSSVRIAVGRNATEALALAAQAVIQGQSGTISKTCFFGLRAEINKCRPADQLAR